MDSDGGWPVRITTDRPAFQYWWGEVPQWSPDSRWLAFTSHQHIHVVPVSGGLPNNVSDYAKKASAPRWMPDSLGLIIKVERYDFDNLILTDRMGSWPFALTTGYGDDSDAQPSPDGRWVAYVHAPYDDLNRTEIRKINIANSEIVELSGSPQTKDWSPRWSPDGKTMAFLSQRSGYNELWMMNPEDGNIQQLTNNKCDLANIIWSPDGRQIACAVNRNGAFDLGLIDSKTGKLVDLRSELGYYARPNWSPKGDFMTVEYMDPQIPPDIFRMPVSTTHPRPIENEEMEQLTFSNLPALEQLEQVIPETTSYKSYDGVEIPCLLYKPTNPNGAGIVHPHGGPRDQYGYEWDVFVQYLVAKGYTYLAVNFRGSTGYGVEFEHLNDNNWGIGDTQDCLYGARYLASLDWIKPESIGIMGGSYGGYMVACCLSRDPDYLFACGVSLYGDANVISSWAQCERETRIYTEMQLGHPSVSRQVYMEASPIYQAENIKKPVLILHGLDDDVVPPQSSEEWVEALRRADKPYEYKTYGGESHGFLKRVNVIDAYQRIERFLDWYLIPL